MQLSLHDVPVGQVRRQHQRLRPVSYQHELVAHYDNLPVTVDMPTYDMQRFAPFGRLSPRQTHVLPWERLHPFIRIAHRPYGALRIAERVILDYELVLPLLGDGELCFGDAAPMPFRPGTLYILPPFTPHSIYNMPQEPCLHIAIHFDFAPDMPPAGSVADRVPYDVVLPQGARLPATAPAPVGGDVEHRLMRLVDLVQSGGARAMATAVAELGLLLIELVASSAGDPGGALSLLSAHDVPREPFATSGERAAAIVAAKALANVTDRQDPNLQIAINWPISASDASGDGTADHRERLRMERVIAWVAAHHADHLQLGDLAAVAGLSASQFSRCFRQWSGYSPMDYLKRVRIEQARVLLHDLDLSIKEVAHTVGFDDPYHFSRVFRQIDGLTPTQYRDAALAGRPNPPA